MATLEVTLKTGSDDLRGGSWADFCVKLQNRQLKKFPEFTGRGGLRNGSNVTKNLEIPELSDPNQIEYCQIQHISQEGFAQTADNWNLDKVQVVLRFGRFPLVVAEHGAHRFQGNSRLLTIYPPQ
ncbi:hypothetical protein [Dapis sp. BLCC M229]|uniref:hypothetical protein n=1 Tax=Dapis sp. BLCC M229 TaxID=3400188 RepID=UPI003CEF9058